MKGILLAGGTGTRLLPLTSITNKHLLPVYDKPMILYPLQTLKDSGIEHIMIVCGKEHGGDFMNFLGSGKEYGVHCSYALQHGPGGIAEALSLAEDFADNEQIAVILGDNIFEDTFSDAIKDFVSQKDGAMVFIKSVEDPARFGVVERSGDTIVNIKEKPKSPKSNFVTTGFFLYNPDVFQHIRTLTPSGRGELEITDVHNQYVKEKKLSYREIKGFWSDAGTFSSLFRAAAWRAEGK